MLDLRQLEGIIQKTRNLVEQSREELYQIGESAREEYERSKRELEQVKQEISTLIREVDHLEREYEQSRVHLIQVSRGFNLYSEAEIKAAYDNAHKKQIELLNKREQEKLMRLHRDHLERN